MNKYLSEKFKLISLFSMILVVLFHSYNIYSKLKPEDVPAVRGYNFFVQEFFSEGIARIAVPIFFIISGYLFFLKSSGTRDEFMSKIRKRFTTLVIPYLFWSTWGLVFFFILQSIPQSRSFFGNKLIVNYSAVELIKTILIDPIPYQLWFVRDLILIVLFTPVIYILITYTKWIAPMLFFIIWMLRIKLVILSNEAVFFFILGAYMSLTNSSILLLKRPHQYNFLWIILWLTIVLTNTVIFFNHPAITPLTDLIMKAGIIAGVIAVWNNYDNFFDDRDPSNLFLFKLAQFSFFLFAFHEPILTVIKKGLFFVIGKSELNSLLVYFSAPILVICVAICVGYCLKKLIPKFYMIVTGGR